MSWSGSWCLGTGLGAGLGLDLDLHLVFGGWGSGCLGGEVRDVGGDGGSSGMGGRFGGCDAGFCGLDLDLDLGLDLGLNGLDLDLNLGFDLGFGSGLEIGFGFGLGLGFGFDLELGGLWGRLCLGIHLYFGLSLDLCLILDLRWWLGLAFQAMCGLV